ERRGQGKVGVGGLGTIVRRVGVTEIAPRAEKHRQKAPVDAVRRGVDVVGAEFLFLELAPAAVGAPLALGDVDDEPPRAPRSRNVDDVNELALRAAGGSRAALTAQAQRL